MPDAGIGTLISAGASIVGGAMSADASKSAANTQAQAGQSAISEQKREFDIAQSALQPYKDVGQAALYKLSDYLGLPVSGAQATMPTQAQFTRTGAGTSTDYGNAPAFDQAGYDAAMAKYNAANTGSSTVTGSLLKPFSFDISQDPGYQFRLDQGNQNVENSAAARGTQLSGATLKELLKYGSDYASGEYNAAFQRDQATKAQIYGDLSGVAGMGVGATTTGVNAGANTASNIGNTITGIGNAQAAGQIGSSNALSGAFTNVGNTITQQQLLSSILKPQGVQNVNAGVDLTGQGVG